MANRRFSLFRRRRPPAPLSCRELVQLVTDYLEGALAPVDAARFEGHIAGCEGCTMYMRQMREMLALFGELTPESLSPQTDRDLRAAFRDWNAGGA